MSDQAGVAANQLYQTVWTGPPAIFPDAQSDQKRDVRIQPVSNGFIITIGCKTFVSEKWLDAARGLELYFKDPKAAIKKYLTPAKPQKSKE